VTRREFFALGSVAPFARVIPLRLDSPARKLRLGVIADLHHGLAPDALSRLKAFVDAAQKREGLDAVVQLGDFNYSQSTSKECVDLFNQLDHPKLHVLGNHDMDQCDKAAAIKFWGMKARYYARSLGGYRFIVLDLNHFKKDGKLNEYASGNYFAEGASCNWADPEQLDWLAQELQKSNEPVILLSHQPLGFADPNQPIPPEQQEVLNVVDKAAKDNPRGAVAISMFGHLHIDRLEHVSGVPYYCVNSASYFWYQGMRAYTRPLYAFMEVGTDGVLKVEGVSGEFVKPPPKESDTVPGRSASIQRRAIGMRTSKRITRT
jgi:predicted phosphodiesterase